MEIWGKAVCFGNMAGSGAVTVIDNRSMVWQVASGTGLVRWPVSAWGQASAAFSDSLAAFLMSMHHITSDGGTVFSTTDPVVALD